MQLPTAEPPVVPFGCCDFHRYGGLFGLSIELMAVFEASWCGVRLPEHGPAVAAPDPPRTGGTAPSDALAAFVADLVESRQPMPFAELQEAYADRCKAAGKPPKSARALGLALTEAGFAKSKADGGKIHYGARLRKGLAVVAA